MLSPELPRGRQPSLARSAEILWAAAALFGTKGIAATTTREIAAQAGTTERTLFKHFGSKDGLVRAVLDEAVLAHIAPHSLGQLAGSIQAFGGDLQGWHERLLAERLKALGSAPDLTRLLLTELLRDEAVRARFAEHWLGAAWEPLVALFAQLQAQARMRTDIAAESLARQFLSLNLGFLLGRVLLAPDHVWDDAGEIRAVASGFAALSGADRMSARPAGASASTGSRGAPGRGRPLRPGTE